MEKIEVGDTVDILKVDCCLCGMHKEYEGEIGTVEDVDDRRYGIRTVDGHYVWSYHSSVRKHQEAPNE